MNRIHALVRAFKSPRGYAFGVALAAIVALPTLAFDLFVDDYVHLYSIEEGNFTPGTKWDLFRFAPGDPELIDQYLDRGPLPWYTLRDINLHFFRPLSSALMTLDRTLFGRNYVLYHLHSILWYVALTWVVARLFRRTLPGGIGVLALVLYALNEAHFIPVGWWSNRNALVAAVPALMGLLAHLRWREDGWRLGLPLSLLGYGVGFLGGETALGVMGYLGAYELLGDRHPWKSRIAALTPAALLSVAYLLVYKVAGFGVHGSGIYLDPLAEPLVFLAQAPARLAELIGQHFFSLPVELSVARRWIEVPMVLLSLALFAIILVLIRQLWSSQDSETRRGLRWLFAGALFSAAPVLATFPSSRLMLLPSIGGAAAIALIVHAWWTRVGARPLLRTTAIAMVALHIVVPFAAWPAATGLVRLIKERTETAVFATEIDEEKAADTLVTVLTAPDPFMGFYPMIVRAVHGRDISRSWQTLSVAPFTHRLTRTGDASFELETLEGEMLGTLFERLFRAEEPRMEVGEEYKTRFMTVTVLDMTDIGPRKIGVSYHLPLDAPEQLFLVWKGDHLGRFEFPPLGEAVEIKNEGGLFGLKFLLGQE